MSGERIAEKATAYLAIVDELAAIGRDPAAAARKVKPPPLDVETIYSEGAWARADRLGRSPLESEAMRRLLR